MNRLILLGNGFDLAHGLKTSYNDFIIWYLKYSFDKAYNEQSHNDGLMAVQRESFPELNFHNIREVSKYIDFHYKRGLNDLLYNNPVDHNGQRAAPFFKVTLKSEFWKKLLLTCSSLGWVDIEIEFYEQLKRCLAVTEPTNKAAELLEINSTLEKVITLLKQYLGTINSSSNTPAYNEIFESPIYSEDVVNKRTTEDEMPLSSLVLNFNYTNTVERYFPAIKQVLSENPVRINYIHGNLKDDTNPLIFGFGDELDENYLKMEQEKIKGFLKYIKSFWYFKTSNYHNLIRFIEAGKFQVFTLGHSCGLSDRTMLNMIFEHENCKSIKIFYHEHDGHNNYTELTEEISRHFKDKAAMRKKIVPFTRSIPMPQL